MNRFSILCLSMLVITACSQQSTADTSADVPDEVPQGTMYTYNCDNDVTINTLVGSYVNKGEIVTLGSEEIALLDRQTGIMHVLSRVPAASGEKFEGVDGVVFWSKADAAIVMNGDSLLYENCTLTS